jgi:hypothetical protein
MTKYHFRLSQIPKSTGGVKYDCIDVNQGTKPWSIYIPQSELIIPFPREIRLSLEFDAQPTLQQFIDGLGARQEPESK